MTAQDLATALVKRYAYTCREALSRSARNYGDPFDNGVFLVVLVAVEEAFSFSQAEAENFIRIVSANEEV